MGVGLWHSTLMRIKEVDDWDEGDNQRTWIGFIRITFGIERGRVGEIRVGRGHRTRDVLALLVVVVVLVNEMYVVCFPLSLYLDSNLISSVEPKLTDMGFYMYTHTGIKFNIIITKSK